jgi:hypothetical protein
MCLVKQSLYIVQSINEATPTEITQLQDFARILGIFLNTNTYPMEEKDRVLREEIGNSKNTELEDFRPTFSQQQ